MTSRHAKAVAVAVAVLAAAAGLAGCADGDRDPPATRAPATAQTRAAPAAFTQACAREAGTVRVNVLCPARLPASSYEPARNYGDAPCTYLLNFEPRDMSRRAGAVFHLLIGGRCRAWDLRTRGGGWPADLTPGGGGDDLRLVGTESLQPGGSPVGERLGLRVVRRARVGSAAALVLRNPPYPAGGIHGGHISVVWNDDGAGYVVSGHALASGGQSGEPGPRALARATQTLLAVAASMRRVAPTRRASRRAR